MGKARSLTERLAHNATQKALASMTLTDRLLAHVLMELMATRGRREQGDYVHRLKAAGLTMKQIAALLDTTPASLAVGVHRKKVASRAPEARPDASNRQPLNLSAEARTP